MTKVMSKIVGMTFRDPKSRNRLNSLWNGESLVLEREPSNPYDHNAVKILSTDNIHLGYIRRELAQTLAEEMDKGVDFFCCVETKTGGTEGKENIGVNISLQRAEEV